MPSKLNFIDSTSISSSTSNSMVIGTTNSSPVISVPSVGYIMLTCGAEPSSPGSTCVIGSILYVQETMKAIVNNPLKNIFNFFIFFKFLITNLLFQNIR